MRVEHLTMDNVMDFCDLLIALGAEDVVDIVNDGSVKKMLAAAASKKQDKEKEEEDLKSLGILMAVKAGKFVLRNIPRARKEIYHFVAACCVCDDGTEATVDDIKKMRPGEFIRLTKSLFSHEDLSDFFTAVSELLPEMVLENLKNSSTGDTEIPIVG